MCRGYRSFSIQWSTAVPHWITLQPALTTFRAAAKFEQSCCRTINHLTMARMIHWTHQMACPASTRIPLASLPGNTTQRLRARKRQVIRLWSSLPLILHTPLTGPPSGWDSVSSSPGVAAVAGNRRSTLEMLRGTSKHFNLSFRSRISLGQVHTTVHLERHVVRYGRTEVRCGTLRPCHTQKLRCGGPPIMIPASASGSPEFVRSPSRLAT
jgi:hypothetical protein